MMKCRRRHIDLNSEWTKRVRQVFCRHCIERTNDAEHEKNSAWNEVDASHEVNLDVCVRSSITSKRIVWERDNDDWRAVKSYDKIHECHLIRWSDERYKFQTCRTVCRRRDAKSEYYSAAVSIEMINREISARLRIFSTWTMSTFIERAVSCWSSHETLSKMIRLSSKSAFSLVHVIS